jgi:8-oxo-dGTP pyrophosphatase MutT (NUDIX family)
MCCRGDGIAVGASMLIDYRNNTMSFVCVKTQLFCFPAHKALKKVACPPLSQYHVTMSKPIKYAVAVVIKRQKDSPEFLIVRRPDDDPDMGGYWGFPAISLQPGELPEQAVARLCKEKLDCEATAVRFLGAMEQRRNAYDIFFMDIEAVLAPGSEPNVHEATTTHTAYSDQKWSTDPMEIMPSAKDGSCCSTLFLTDQGLLDRDEWVSSLEGSDIVS